MYILKKRIKKLSVILLTLLFILTNNSLILNSNAIMPGTYRSRLEIGDVLSPNSTYHFISYNEYTFNFVENDTLIASISAPTWAPLGTGGIFYDNWDGRFEEKSYSITQLDGTITDYNRITSIYCDGAVYFYNILDSRNGFIELSLIASSDNIDDYGTYGVEFKKFNVNDVPSNIPKHTIIALNNSQYATTYVSVTTPMPNNTENFAGWKVLSIDNNVVTLGDSMLVTDLHAYYNDKVLVGDEFDVNKLQIEVGYSNGDHDYISYDSLSSSPESKIVSNTGYNNEYTITYKGLTASFGVYGYDYDKIEAVYDGPIVQVGKDYDINNVLVTAYYTDNMPCTQLSSDKWTPSSTKIMKIGDNKFTVKLKDKPLLTAKYVVPGEDSIVAINAKYVGKNIHVGENYNKDDVVITATYKTGGTRILGSEEWSADSQVVSKIDNNTFIATFDDLTASYDITGYTEKSISAEYRGHNIITGENYKKEDVLVFVYYTDGKARLLHDNEWTETSLTVTDVGSNVYTASYKNFKDVYDVTGEKKLTGLTADYIGDDVNIGYNYSKSDVDVHALYHDGSKEQLLEDDWQENSLIVAKKGNNDFTAIYRNQIANYKINGVNKPESAIQSISAIYKGEDINVGQKYNKSDVEVIAMYTDGTTKTLTDNEWSHSSLVVDKEGSNQYIATYQDKKASYYVNGINPIVSIEATYIGDDIIIGEEYLKSDVNVIVTYEDGGQITLNEDDWEESSLLISKVGKNKFTAKYYDFETDYFVTGTSNDTPKDSPEDPNIVHTGVQYPYVIVIILLILCILSIITFRITKENN